MMGSRPRFGSSPGEIEIMSLDQFNAFISKERAINAEIVQLIGYQAQ